jgi:putative phosphoesterase
MRIGFVADAHGNPFGLNLCLQALREESVSEIYFLGDAVGYFPDADSVLETLASNQAHCLMGNHEAMLLGRLPLDSKNDEVYRLSETRHRVGTEQIRAMENWKEQAVLNTGGRKIFCVHGRPGEPLTGYLYPDDDPPLDSDVKADVLVTAHTHRPALKKNGKLLLINPGSAGLPRQGGRQASCAVYDTELNEAWLRWVPLPVEELIQHYNDSIHPQVKNVLRR